VQCVNPIMEPAALRAKFMVGKFHSIQEGDAGSSLGKTTGHPYGQSETGPGPCRRLVRKSLSWLHE